MRGARIVHSDDSVDQILVEDWVTPTFSGAWANAGGTSNPCGFWMDPWGVLHLRGVVKTGATGSAIFTLPPRRRPLFTETLATWCTAGLATVTVSAVGVVTAASGRTASSDSITLDGLTFRVGQ